MKHLKDCKDNEVYEFYLCDLFLDILLLSIIADNCAGCIQIIILEHIWPWNRHWPVWKWPVQAIGSEILCHVLLCSVSSPHCHCAPQHTHRHHEHLNWSLQSKRGIFLIIIINFIGIFFIDRTMENEKNHNLVERSRGSWTVDLPSTPFQYSGNPRSSYFYDGEVWKQEKQREGRKQ